MKTSSLRIVAVLLVPASFLLAVNGCGDEEESLPTVSPVPSLETPLPATPSATPAPTASPSPVPTGMVRYTHPTYGYSFEYPAAWFLNAPPLPSETIGSSVTLTQWDPHTGPSQGTQLDYYLKIDVGTIINSDNVSTEQWVAQKGIPEGVTLLSSEAASIGGEPATRQERILADGTPLTVIFVARDDFIYEVSAYHDSESATLLIFDQFVDSFRFAQ